MFVLLGNCDGRLTPSGWECFSQNALDWAPTGASKLTLHQCAYHLELLRRTGEPESLDFTDVQQAASYIVPAIAGSLGMCVPSPDAWQALIRLCTAALSRLYKIR